MKKNLFYLIMMLFLFVACGGSNDNTFTPESMGNNNDTMEESNSQSAWLIPISEVKDGGPGKDGIPSIDSPKFVNVSDAGANFLNGNDLVVGIVYGNQVKTYPHLILDRHEIVNDQLDNQFITISYCPLTGTAFGWESVINGVKSTFGVSGLLYNTNLILYDRSTNSNWSQLALKCVNGDRIGDQPLLGDVV